MKPQLAKSPHSPAHAAIWNLGFRPLYLAGALWAALAIPLWVLQWRGVIQTSSHLTQVAWHMHEMIFGYAFAIIAGFLLTAVKTWTGRYTPSGWPLALIVTCWVIARVLYLTPWSLLGIVFETLFFLLTACGIGKPIVAAGNRQNLLFVLVTLLAGLLNLVFHAALLGLLSDSAIDWRTAAISALDVVSMVIVIVTGRVMPMFTRNGAPGSAPKSYPLLEKIVLLAIFASAVINIIFGSGAAYAVSAIVAAMLLLVRWALCSPLATWRNPILWSLHAALVWLPIGYSLRAYSAIDASVTATLGIHALTIGVIGGLTLAMMTRTARGHTGRILKASLTETCAYVFIIGGAAVRVLMPLILPTLYLESVLLSAALWTLAFCLYLKVFAPWLLSARIDGKPG
jgi:uncharacterized protein involved in response to NO